MHTHSLSIHPDSGRALRPWELALLLAVCVTLLTGTWAQARSQLLAARLVRLHVIAVSDDDAEQAVKLQVRDAVLAEGRGERLTPVTPMPRMPVVICKPDFPISTPELFHRVDARTSRCRPDTEGICAALADGDMPRLARRMYNVFEDVLTHREGEIAAIKSRLLDGGALGAVMSGTGSAVFGIFADADSAAYAKRRLARDYAECFLTETIGRLEI